MACSKFGNFRKSKPVEEISIGDFVNPFNFFKVCQSPPEKMSRVVKEGKTDSY